MNKKELIVILVSIIIILITIFTKSYFQGENDISINYLVVSRLCDTKGSEEIYLNIEYPAAVHKCGDYYEVLPRRGSADAPIEIYNSTGDGIASCGGMPGPAGDTTPEICSRLNCSSNNLCKGIELNCSRYQFRNTKEDRYFGMDEEFYQSIKDRCNSENSIRIKDKKYCGNIIDANLKDWCINFDYSYS